MQKQQSNRKIWAWLTGLLILFLLVSYFIQTYDPKVYPNYVSESPSPTGVKAIYTYLESQSDVKRWNHSPDLLPTKKNNQTLVMVEPYFTLQQEGVASYRSFIEAGNKIVLFKSNPKGMFDINTEPVFDDETDENSGVILNQMGIEYRADLASTVRILPETNDTIMLQDKLGVVAVSRKIGKGELIVSIAPEWVMNQNLLKFDHIPLVLSLLGNAHTYSFDEYIHGDQNAVSMANLYPDWFLLLLLQGTIIAVFWLWYKGKRFGSILVPREETVRFSDEGIRALSAWYIRGKYYHDSLLIQADYVKVLLQEKWGVPYHKEWTELSIQLEKRWISQKPTEIKAYLRDLTDILKNNKLSKQEYLLWSKKLDDLRKEVEQG